MTAVPGRRGQAAGMLLTSLAAALSIAAADAADACAAPGAAARADVASDTILLDEPPPHRAHLQYDDGEPGPPPAVGHWRLAPPQGRELPSDPDHLLVVAAPGPTSAVRAAPVFAGAYVGTLRTIGVQLSRGHAADAIPAQTTLAIRIVVDEVTIADAHFPVLSDSGRPDACHLAHLGMYYVMFTDVDVALAAHGIDNRPGVPHRLSFGFAPTGDDGAPSIEVFGIDTQPATSVLSFNGPYGPGPRHSLAVSTRCTDRAQVNCL